jgi:hypothetical protein
MKVEVEHKWLVNLLSTSKLSNSFLKKGGGSIKDFEKYAEAPLNSKEFRKFFSEMRDRDVISFSYEKENGGNPSKIYVLNKSKCLKYLKTFETYQKSRKITLAMDM